MTRVGHWQGLTCCHALGGKADSGDGGDGHGGYEHGEPACDGGSGDDFVAVSLQDILDGVHETIGNGLLFTCFLNDGVCTITRCSKSVICFACYLLSLFLRILLLVNRL